MENCEEADVHNVNIRSPIVSVEKEPLQSEETVCDENSASVAAAVNHTEDDEDFEDALDNLTLLPSAIANEHAVVNGCYDVPAEREMNTLQTSWDNLEGASGEILHADRETGAGLATPSANESISDSRHSSLSGDEEVISEKQGTASDTVIVDEEVLREREACLTDEQKQVIRWG